MVIGVLRRPRLLGYQGIFMAKTGIRAPRVQTEAPLEDLRGMHEQGRCYVPAVSTDYWSFSSIGTIKSNGWIFPALVGTCKGERVPGDGGTPRSNLYAFI